MEDNGREKPFGTVDKVLLFMIAAVSDTADFVTAFAFPIPVIGQILYFGNAFVLSPIIWATIQFWFIMKVGFGGPGLVNIAGGIGNLIGIPGSEIISVGVAIYLANHPRAATVAAVAVGKVSGAKKAIGEEVAVGEEAVATEKAVAAEARVTEATKVGAEAAEVGTETERAGEARPSRTREGAEEIPEGKPSEQREPEKPEVPKEALGEEPTEFEKLQKLLKETPQAKKKSEAEEEEENEELPKAA